MGSEQEEVCRHEQADRSGQADRKIVLVLPGCGLVLPKFQKIVILAVYFCKS